MTAEQRAELVELARMAILYQQRPHCQIHSQLVIHDYLKSLRWPEADQVSREIIAEALRQGLKSAPNSEMRTLRVQS